MKPRNKAELAEHLAYSILARGPADRVLNGDGTVPDTDEAVAAVVELWHEAVPRSVSVEEGDLLSQMLVNLLEKLRQRGFIVPHVTIFKVAKD